MVGKYPRFRTHVRRGRDGKVWISYYLDMRAEGKKDIPLGTDRAAALAKWAELTQRKPKLKGRLQEAFDRFREEALPHYASSETRRGYAKSLARLEAWGATLRWEQVDFPMLRQYLRVRTAKTQANREMSLLKIIWDMAADWRMHALLWPAMGRRGWKNEETAREFEVTDELFAAVYAQADQVLRDCMDIASATGMRLTDVRTILLPTGDLLRLKASKTGKKADFDLALSVVLPELLARRRELKADHLMLLSTPTGRPVSATMLRYRYDDAREKAARRAAEEGSPGLAGQIRRMVLRDMRKLAGDLAPSDEKAAELLQHSSVSTTRRHYRTKVTKIKPVR